MRTVLYTHGGGRLGNQVLRFLHWIAWAREQGGEIEVRNLAFWPYARFFATWRQHPGCVFPLRGDRWDELARWHALLPEYVSHRLDWRVLRAVQALGAHRAGWQEITLNIARAEALELASPDFRARVDKQAVTTCAGWRITAWDLVAQQADILRGYFQPEPAIAARAAEFIGRLRKRHGFLIGVFIRQEDYRQWLDGRYYFSMADYARWIREALALYADRRPAAVVAAAEWQGDGSFVGLPVYPSTGNPGQGGHWFEQWAQLAQCDVVLSVPSTFAATAAFSGNLPLWPILRTDQRLAADQIITDGLLGATGHAEYAIAVN